MSMLLLADGTDGRAHKWGGGVDTKDKGSKEGNPRTVFERGGGGGMYVLCSNRSAVLRAAQIIGAAIDLFYKVRKETQFN